MLTPVSGRQSQRQLSATPGVVRIIGGSWRGSRLVVPARPGLRPTPDRVRETLFNWLAPVLAGSRCLDLFAGTGALGLEAASRGAGEVLLVERDPAALAALREHVERLRATQVRIQAGDALDFLRTAPAQPFNLVFLDPPYEAGLLAPALANLRAGPWLAPGASIYCEWPQDQPPPLAQPAWRSGRAGSVQYALYRPEPGPG
jgi:16S rRNA (guanine966-N2)-methyltransferase